MRDLHELDRYRDRSAAVAQRFGWYGDATCGAFVIPSPIDRQPMIVVASANEGWDHVSVSRRNRCPNWAEMEHVKRLMFRDDETAIQLHVPVTAHISLHPHCLHLWRHQSIEIPLPPAGFV